MHFCVNTLEASSKALIMLGSQLFMPLQILSYVCPEVEEKLFNEKLHKSDYA